MKSIVVTAFGGPNQLTLTEGPPPSPQKGQVLIAVEAIGVGYVDVMAREGRYPLIQTPGFVPGSEVAGVVEAVGDEVDREWMGRRVFARVTTGGYAESVAVPIGRVFPLPEGVTARDAVALGINALVAKIALDRVHVEPTQSILVRGAGGGIGLMAIQMGAWRTGDVTAITSSKERGDRLRDLGASKILNRHSESHEAPEDYDVIVDTVGGADIAQFINKLRPNGRYILCGGVGGMPPADFGASLLTTFHKSPAFFAFSLNSVSNEDLGAAAAAIFGLAASGQLRAVIAEILPLSRAIEAHTRLEAGTVFGKIVLTP